ncbi:MAG TPA: DUF3987 domain-containing protein [Gemmataceae bacterium]|nr:DUF3987 domain-containing protein [Gemmataceae bacterium]
MASRAAVYRDQLTPALAARLAGILAVPESALRAVGLGADRAASVWTFEERDGSENIFGFATRNAQGEKKSVALSKRGLAIPAAWRERRGTLYVVEGHSDAASMWAAELRAVGRPSNSCGANHLATLALQLTADEDVILVVENDQKPTGEWPGRDGSSKVARQVARSAGRRVGVSPVPDGTKDVRAWLTHDSRREIDWPERGRQLATRLMAAVESVEPPAASLFQIGDRVRPTDRGNLGTVTEDLGGGRYRVEFVGREGTAEKTFDAAELGPDRPRPGGSGGDAPPDPVPPWQPFPLDCLPTVLGDFCAGVAAALGADPALAAVPALAAAAGAVGNARTVCIKRGWSEPAVLWTAVIGEPGDKKTPALSAAFRPVWQHQENLQRDYVAALGEWSAEKARARAADEDDRADPGPRPRPGHAVVVDITVEALAERLCDNPRGLVCAPDELRGWVSSFDRYRSGKDGGDRAFWLSAHDARPAKVDRKTVDRPTIFVPRAAVSLCGGAQPVIWRNAICDAEADADGLAARVLHTMPPDPGIGWTDAEIGGDVAAAYTRCLDRLFGLGLGQGGEPVEISLSPDARMQFVALTNEMAREKQLAMDWERPVIAKLNKHAARLALVLQLADDPTATQVSARWMTAAIRLAKWFLAEAHRVRCVLAADPVEARLDRLERAADANGGRLAPRDLIERNRRRFPNAEVARAALDELVARRPDRWGWVDVLPGPQGGRPGRHVERLEPDGAAEGALGAPSTTSSTAGPVNIPGADNSCAVFAGRSQQVLPPFEAPADPGEGMEHPDETVGAPSTTSKTAGPVGVPGREVGCAGFAGGTEQDVPLIEAPADRRDGVEDPDDPIVRVVEPGVVEV